MALSTEEVFAAIREGSLSQEAFEEWVSEKTGEAYVNGADAAGYYASMPQ